MRKYFAFDEIRGVNYPTPFLKDSGIIFLNTEQNKSRYLHDEMVFFFLYTMIIRYK